MYNPQNAAKQLDDRARRGEERRKEIGRRGGKVTGDTLLLFVFLYIFIVQIM